MPTAPEDVKNGVRATDRIARATRSSPTPITCPAFCRRRTAVSTSGFHPENKGSIPFVDTNARPLVEALHANTLVRLQTDPPTGPTPAVRHFPRMETNPSWLSHSGARLFCRCRTAVSTPVSRTGDTGSIPVTDTTQPMLVHGRGSYPRIGWFDSIGCDGTARRGASGEATTVSVNHALWSVRLARTNAGFESLHRGRSPGCNSAAEYVVLTHVRAGASPATRTVCTQTIWV